MLNFPLSDSFEKVHGKYDLVKLDYNADEAEEEAVKKQGASKKVEAEKEKPTIPESQLEEAVQNLVSERPLPTNAPM